MAKSVVIRDVVYADVPSVSIPLSSGSGNAEFFDISASTLDSAGKLLDGVKAPGADGTIYTGNIPTKSGSDLTVSGDTVTVPSGYYSSQATKAVASGTVTAPASISGSSSTISTSSGTITLTKTVSVTPSVTTAGYISSGTAGNSSVSLSASATIAGATTYHPSTSDQTISSGTYTTGAQTIKAVTYSGLSASNIVSGVTVKIGDSTDDDCVASVSGTAQIPIISQDSTTKVLSIS